MRSELDKAIYDWREYCEEEEIIERRLKIFLDKHPTSALMEIISRVLIEKESGGK